MSTTSQASRSTSPPTYWPSRRRRRYGMPTER
nr:MAG TPA: hypothetical protein [Caudoviricetes sp.]